MTGSQPDALSIPRNNLGESVYRLLWGRILDRRLKPGEKLSGLRLSDELGVSRTLAREALQCLVSDGILRVEPNRGFVVESFSARDIGEIYDLRATLEAMALTETAAHFTRPQLDQALADLATLEQWFRAARTESDRVAAARAFLEVDRGFTGWSSSSRAIRDYRRSSKASGHRSPCSRTPARSAINGPISRSSVIGR